MNHFPLSFTTITSKQCVSLHPQKKAIWRKHKQPSLTFDRKTLIQVSKSPKLVYTVKVEMQDSVSTKSFAQHQSIFCFGLLKVWMISSGLHIYVLDFKNSYIKGPFEKYGLHEWDFFFKHNAINYVGDAELTLCFCAKNKTDQFLSNVFFCGLLLFLPPSLHCLCVRLPLLGCCVFAAGVVAILRERGGGYISHYFYSAACFWEATVLLSAYGLLKRPGRNSLW